MYSSISGCIGLRYSSVSKGNPNSGSVNQSHGASWIVVDSCIARLWGETCSTDYHTVFRCAEEGQISDFDPFPRKIRCRSVRTQIQKMSTSRRRYVQIPGYRSVRKCLSSANRRRSTSLTLFVSFTQPCDQHDRMIRTIRKSAARWRGRRAQGYRKLILRANLLYVPNIKM